MIAKLLSTKVFYTTIHHAFRGGFLCPSLSKSHRSRMASSVKQMFDYFLVLDFEATCDNKVKLKPQEIIEFPVLKVNGVTFNTEATFHQYVQPQVHAQLTSFCTELTGIIQSQVDDQPSLQETLQLFDKWMRDEGLLETNIRSIFVTCGEWDLQTMLPQQCRYFGVQAPDYFKRWINIKKPFCDMTGTFPKGMLTMLQMLNIKHQGRHHSGIDDCINIAAILKVMAQKGCIFKANGELRTTGEHRTSGGTY